MPQTQPLAWCTLSSWRTGGSRVCSRYNTSQILTSTLPQALNNTASTDKLAPASVLQPLFPPQLLLLWRMTTYANQLVLVNIVVHISYNQSRIISLETRVVCHCVQVACTHGCQGKPGFPKQLTKNKIKISKIMYFSSLCVSQFSFN